MTAICLALFRASVSTSLVVAVLILLTPLLNRRYAAKWKYLAWIFLALRLLVPFGGTYGPWAMDFLPQRKAQTTPVWGDADTWTEKGLPFGRIMVEIPPQMTAPLSGENGKNNGGMTLLDLAAAVWMLGSLGFFSVHFGSYFHYKRQVAKKGRPVGDRQILCLLSRLRGELHIRYNVQMLECSIAESPLILGFFKPILVLPEESYSQEELFFILKHELVHVKRGDVYGKLLFVIVNGIYWFHPLIWIMRKEAAMDMELSCDERVTLGAGYEVRKAYTETLLSMLHRQCTKRLSLTTQFYGGKRAMKKRFQNILSKRKKKNGMALFLGTILLTACLGALVGCSLEEEGREAKEPVGVKELKEEALSEAEKSAEQAEHTRQQGEEGLSGEETEAMGREAFHGPKGNQEAQTEGTEYLSAEDCREIRNMVDVFAKAYFDGNTDALQGFLSSTYEGKIEGYESTGAVSDFTWKGLSDTDDKKIKEGRAIVSLEFRDSTYEDMFLYVTFVLVREEDGWKIEFYGVEG